MNDQFTDEELFAKMAKGENEGYKILYVRYRDKIIRSLLFKSHSKDEANDIFQIAVLRLYERILDGRIAKLQKGSSLESLLKGFVRNICKEIQKSHTTSILNESLLEGLIEDNEEQETEEAYYLIIERSLKTLGHSCQKLLSMYYFSRQKFTHDKIAKMLGYKNANSAKNNKAKCLKKLREAIKKAL